MINHVNSSKRPALPFSDEGVTLLERFSILQGLKKVSASQEFPAG